MQKENYKKKTHLEWIEDKFRNYKIKEKLFRSFNVTMGIFIVSVIMGLIAVGIMGNSFKSFYNKPYKNSRTQMEIRKCLQQVEKNVLLATMTDDKTLSDEYLGNANNFSNKVTEGVDFLEKNFPDKELVNKLKSLRDKQYTSKEELINLVREGKKEEAKKYYASEYEEQITNLEQVLIEIGEYADNRAKKAYNNSVIVQIVIFVVLILMSIIGTLCCYNISKALINVFSKPMKELEETALKLENGELNINIEYESDDEFGKLADSFRKTTYFLKTIVTDINNTLYSVANADFTVESECSEQYKGDFESTKESIDSIIEALNKTFNDILVSTDQVSNSSQQVSKASQDIAVGATEQATGIEELTALVGEINEKVKTAADNADHTKNIVRNLGSEIEDSNRQVESIVSAMDEIQSSSQNIKEIINTISGIAEQTNMLALNAAIEAARAGESGKGFAVVADQVRRLAEDCTKSAQDTGALIEISVKCVNEGIKLVDDTATSLKQIVKNSEEAVGLVDNIAVISREQSQAIEQINGGLNTIVDVVQSNSAISEESAAASEELSHQAKVLEEMVSRVKLQK